MPLKIIRNDITKMNVDAVVNTANPVPKYATGVDRAIYQAAGEEELLAARKEIGHMEEGEVAITNGYDLPAKYIIHAVSPLYIDGESGEEEKLRNCYRRSLALAYENKCETIAFPLISTGGFGYPKEEGMRIAVDEINAFLLNKSMLIYLVVFDATATKLGMNLYSDLEEYIDDNYVSDKEEDEYGKRRFTEKTMCVMSAPKPTTAPMPTFAPLQSRMPMASAVPTQKSAPILDCMDLDDKAYDAYIEEKESALKERMRHMTDTYQEYLFYLIEQKGLSNVDVYKRAIIDKRQFSKIKNNPDYHPDKKTALRLCVGARLNLDETKDILARAGYALSPCDKRDIIFSYFIEREIYDITEIAIALEDYGLESIIE